MLLHCWEALAVGMDCGRCIGYQAVRTGPSKFSTCVWIYIYIYIYMYICMCIYDIHILCVCIYIYICVFIHSWVFLLGTHIYELARVALLWVEHGTGR